MNNTKVRQTMVSKHGDYIAFTDNTIAARVFEVSIEIPLIFNGRFFFQQN